MKHLIPILAILCMVSCKTTQPIAQTNDSVRIEYHLDSVYIYEKDSFYIDRWRTNDTIYITKESWKTRWKDKVVEVHDTISVIQQDTVVQEVVPKFYRDCTIGFWIIIVLIILYIVLRIWLRK